MNLLPVVHQDFHLLHLNSCSMKAWRAHKLMGKELLKWWPMHMQTILFLECFIFERMKMAKFGGRYLTLHLKKNK